MNMVTLCVSARYENILRGTSYQNLALQFSRPANAYQLAASIVAVCGRTGARSYIASFVGTPFFGVRDGATALWAYFRFVVLAFQFTAIACIAGIIEVYTTIDILACCRSAVLHI